MDATAVTSAPAATAVTVRPAPELPAARPSARGRARAEARAARLASRRHAAAALQSAIDRRDNGGVADD
ncbi:hypothetical protein RM844_24245 [Streptomyces sp. DSM 44915]|uniref:Uncharacterized protein n=1 Tax=Streptomyces chisholmiae TaxID=3075540 RepID=A0ABU2JWM0_9ACTN|nr:hypothetical protein [Streptomyces sp. DSM 44915]MDT0269397.1 hypothetical protein [Streptomyces sp. DSM 44915]